jgi:hypothetical protein
MKKLDKKLFQEFKLENSEILKVIGGKAYNTSVGQDTNVSNGGGYDVNFETLNSSGVPIGDDPVLTSPAGDKDKPGC